MMRIRRRSWGLALGLLLAAMPLAAQGPVVHAVLFYSPTCPHCHKVITEDLPPLVQRYGDQLMIVGIDVTTQNGGMLYQEAASRSGIPEPQLGVPLMVVGGQFLMGDQEIPQRLPGIIEAGLGRGGIDWPSLPLLRDALVARGVMKDSTSVASDSAQPSTEQSASERPGAEQPASGSPGAAAPAQSPEQSGPASAPEGISTGLAGTAAAANLTMMQRFALDPVANAVALLVLLLMIAVTGASLSMVRRKRSRFGAGPAWWIPLLAVIGLGIALYLGFVEVTGAQAVCGPVGDCNTVQQSVYARALGMPLGVLGAIGYVVIGLLWVLATMGRGVWRERGAAGLWAATFTGVLFSIYLTFLEPFVIGTICAWCLGSAVTMTLLLAAATGLLGATMQSAETSAASAAGAGVVAEGDSPQ